MGRLRYPQARWGAFALLLPLSAAIALVASGHGVPLADHAVVIKPLLGKWF